MIGSSVRGGLGIAARAITLVVSRRLVQLEHQPGGAEVLAAADLVSSGEGLTSPADEPLRSPGHPCARSAADDSSAPLKAVLLAGIVFVADVHP